MKVYSIKSKLLLAFAALLTIITLLNGLQTSYVINRRGEEEAFAQLSRQLTLFQQELHTLRERQIAVALNGARDDKNLSDLAILYAQTLKFRQQAGSSLERTLSLNKAISLNRLQLIVDSARLSSAAVYLDGELSHYITRDAAGMVSGRDGQETLVGTGLKEGDNAQLTDWRTWSETALPVLVTRHAPVVDRVTVTFEFPAEELMVLRVIVPVQGMLRESFMETIVEHMTISAPETRASPQDGNQTPQGIGMFVFSLAFDTAFLHDLADRTGMEPAIFAPDGQRALQLNKMERMSSALLSGSAHDSILTQTVATRDKTSYYRAMTVWQIDGKPALVLAGTLSREGTLITIRQMIITITGTAVVIFLVAGTFAYLVLTRMLAPITLLTAAVSDIRLDHTRELEPAGREMALHLALERYLDRQIRPLSSDEIGALTSAFNTMAAHLHDLIGNLEAQVQERTDKLEAANKELEVFAYSVSHDLRAPLRGIEGFGQILLDEYQDRMDEQGKNYLHRVRSAAQHMAQLIDDLLNLSRVGRIDMINQQVNLSDIAREITVDLYKTDPERQVVFVIPMDIKAQGDGQLLRIVLDNLIRNAWKFTSKHPKARIEFGLQQQKGTLVYFIRDDGAGFDMKYADKLFGAFQRLHTAKEFPGTGVGLATVQRIIHRHGGKIWAQGEVEKGAVFYFTLKKGAL